MLVFRPLSKEAKEKSDRFMILDVPTGLALS